MKRCVKPMLALMASVLAAHALFAVEAGDGINDGINRNDPKFVTASLLVMSPGDELFSCAGHAVIRMECPTYKLDYCFSYESEDATSRLLAFFAGKLKMGMFAIPTDRMLEMYRQEGREVRQYALNLPPAVKQRLWKLLDDKVAEGANQPYDYIKRGCAWSMLKCILDAVGKDVIEESPWPAKYDEYQRAIIASSLDDYPWARFAIHAIVGHDPDRDIPKVRKLVIPKDCLEYLKGAKLAGTPIIAAGEGIVLVPQTAEYKAPPITPLAAAWIGVIIAVVAAWFKWRWLLGGIVAVQFLLGCGFTYLIVFSSLPATTWNWLFIPFNPVMPVLAAHALWKGSARAMTISLTSCASVLIAWMVYMVFSPHQLTDHAYVVLAGAYALLYIGMAFRQKILKTARVKI